MTLDEIMQELASMGTEQTKKTYIRHGAQEPFFGVKIGDMKKLVKIVKKDQKLALQLYDTGNYDAMYLAGLSVDPKALAKEQLQHWVKQANWRGPAEFIVGRVVAESPYATELAMEWIDSEEELIDISGWSTYANYVSVAPDETLDLDEISSLLDRVRQTVHSERNWVRYVINSFVISVGSYVLPLSEEAKAIAEEIGKVYVDVGDTACKVPLATEYIAKIEDKGRIGKKRKTCIC